MNQVMRDARMVRFLRQNLIKDFGGSVLFCVSHVSAGGGAQQSECIKDSRLMILRIVQVELFHRPLVSKRASAMLDFARVFIETFYHGDVLLV